MNDENQENVYRTADGENPDPLFYLRVTSNGKSWTIRRNHENFRMLDKQLHRCIFDRKYSMLPELRRGEPRADDVQVCIHLKMCITFKRKRRFKNALK